MLRGEASGAVDRHLTSVGHVHWHSMPVYRLMMMIFISKLEFPRVRLNCKAHHLLGLGVNAFFASVCFLQSSKNVR